MKNYEGFKYQPSVQYVYQINDQNCGGKQLKHRRKQRKFHQQTQWKCQSLVLELSSPRKKAPIHCVVVFLGVQYTLFTSALDSEKLQRRPQATSRCIFFISILIPSSLVIFIYFYCPFPPPFPSATEVSGFFVCLFFK